MSLSNKVDLACLAGEGLICRCAGRSEVVASNASEVNLTLQRLFTDHVFYEELYLRSALLNFPDTKLLEARLVANADSIGTFSEKFLGPSDGKEFGNLMKKHLNANNNLI